jgi:hypothetical protein
LIWFCGEESYFSSLAWLRCPSRIRELVVTSTWLVLLAGTGLIYNDLITDFLRGI